MYYLYIIKNSSDKLYVGVTKSIKKRLIRHNQGYGSKYTSVNTSYSCVYKESFDLLSSAMKREKQIKKWSRAKKFALIEGDADLLKQLSGSHRQAQDENRSVSRQARDELLRNSGH